MASEKQPDFDLSHLAPAAREVALLSDHDRIQKIRADRWIGYPRAQFALKRLRELLEWPRKQRMPNLLIVGPSNNAHSGESGHLIRFNAGSASGETRAVQNQHL